jgi:hypothetical protein
MKAENISHKELVIEKYTGKLLSIDENSDEYPMMKELERMGELKNERALKFMGLLNNVRDT